MESTLTPSDSPEVAGYRLTYGTVTGTDTNVYNVPARVTVVIFYSLGTNTPYWFFAQGTNTAGELSPRSPVVVATPVVR